MASISGRSLRPLQHDRTWKWDLESLEALGSLAPDLSDVSAPSLSGAVIYCR